MRRPVILMIAVTALFLLAAPAAPATTQTAQSGNVTASFTFQGKFPNYHGERLEISQGGSLLYDQPVTSPVCGTACAPYTSISGHSALDVVDLEHTGQPDVVLDLYSGGAHCCTVVQIFSFDPGTMTYAETERNFGDPPAKIVDLRHDGHYEILTADDSFAYEFTDFAASGLPVDILTFAGGHFANVTRSYPRLVARDAAFWLRAFKGQAGRQYDDSVGVIAAWAADEERLGHDRLVRSFLAQQAKLGHLNSALGPQEPGGSRFVTKLLRFLRRRGYVR